VTFSDLHLHTRIAHCRDFVVSAGFPLYVRPRTILRFAALYLATWFGVGVVIGMLGALAKVYSPI
jgi:hypothetical protein